ncbi:hypothetical protein BCR35DRAFT_307195 [Leucosporidium creatinivorum]|uniref:TPR domain-containing protein n=1 Tax=Leucosporidium creatinivorum TaxID=106004 RepID=A0A1Y2EPD4_9BASI|nr:hypothetical protein BCR35DRAFT_307195 [Leucosporidium creatinivorum]
MGRIKKPSKSSGQRRAPKAEAAAPPPPPTMQELLVKAAQLIASLQYEEAKQATLQALEMAVEKEDTKLCTDSLEILGTVELELGELDQAREHFLLSIEHSSALEDPSPAPHLYLAQLSSPEESLVHFTNALKILQARITAIEQAKLGGDGGDGNEEDLEEEEELRRSASRALVGMTELYLTDLCFDPEAEQNCEKHLALAATIDPTDPEVYQTLASVRMSQERPDDAKKAAVQGWELWRDLGADSEHYPPASARLNLAKLLLELSMHAEALEILQRLENEDDEDSEVWYLSGWAWWLLGESRPEEAPSTDEEESRGECWSEGKLCLENYMRLNDLEPENSDPEQLAHVKELLEKLEKLGVVASAGREEEGEGPWEDEETDDEEEENAMEE